MKKCVQLAVLSTVLISFGSHARVIYGEDHRKEISEATPFQQKLALSAATMISENEMTRDNSKPGLVQFNQKTLSDWLTSQGEQESPKSKKLFSAKVKEAAKSGVSFCEDEKFTDQPNPGMCSGFLIAPDLVLTAGHCVDLPNFCSEYRWVFDFKVNPETKKAGVDIKEEDIYKCKKVVSNLLSMPLGLDYAIVQLDRKVIGREPLDIRNDSQVKDNTSLLVIGSPSGLPLKVADGAKVRENKHPFYFNANLDTFQGNSGSAVFDAETGVVEGILVRGEEDFVPNQVKMCIEAKKCKDNECRGEDITRLTAIPEIGVQVALNKAAVNGDTAVIERILKLNIWVDFYGKDGQSALLKASAAGQIKAMDILIAKGADLKLRDKNGNSAVLLAAQSLKLDAVKFLIGKGAGKEDKNNSGETIISFFEKSGDKRAVKELVSLGLKKSKNIIALR